ncbi:MAG: hypothetical protein NTY38_13940, partial [Acidobacteria bacterium]|nr:hypothetical protein [Acidobacteriota bacterium]
MKLQTFISLLLAALLLLPQPVWTQQTAQPKPAAPEPQAGSLKVTVVEGEGAVNNIRAKTATSPAVEVRDEKGQPVARAEVIFELPYAGPGGTFGQGMRYRTARTNDQGRATATEYVPNQHEGKFNIRVSVSSGPLTANTVIAQSNAFGAGPEAKSSRKT